MTTTTQPKLTYRLGDVVLVLFPHSDLRTAKPRPALVVQADNLQTGLPQVIVAMITSKLLRADHPSRVLVTLSAPNSQQCGLLTDSVVPESGVKTHGAQRFCPDVPSFPWRFNGGRCCLR